VFFNEVEMSLLEGCDHLKVLINNNNSEMEEDFKLIGESVPEFKDFTYRQF